MLPTPGVSATVVILVEAANTTQLCSTRLKASCPFGERRRAWYAWQRRMSFRICVSSSTSPSATVSGARRYEEEGKEEEEEEDEEEEARRRPNANPDRLFAVT